jgi:hypothetical protein
LYIGIGVTSIAMRIAGKYGDARARSVVADRYAACGVFSETVFEIPRRSIVTPRIWPARRIACWLRHGGRLVLSVQTP